ncbi:hypothetical protein [Streptomyces mirabilis]|uniref:hypothetical protein n=1 Tax=Streptomyces mirabilis TaxID=68239 RepID=UPI00331DBC09
MAVYHQPRSERPVSRPPLADRVMTFARNRRGSGLEHFTLDQLQFALRDVDRPALTEALARLTDAGKLMKDSGPLGLGDRRIPDRWSAV